MAGTVVAVVPALTWVVASLRRHQAGVDLIAVLSLIGTMLVHEYLAGALIAVMLAGGRALEAAAGRRASHDLRALLQHAPRSARRRNGSEVTVIPPSSGTHDSYTTWFADSSCPAYSLDGPPIVTTGGTALMLITRGWMAPMGPAQRWVPAA